MRDCDFYKYFSGGGTCGGDFREIFFFLYFYESFYLELVWEFGKDAMKISKFKWNLAKISYYKNIKRGKL